MEIEQVKFSVEAGEIIKGRLLYDESEMSIRFEFAEPTQYDDDEGIASLVLAKFLQLDFRVSDGRLLSIGGYSPRESWDPVKTKLQALDLKDGIVRVSMDEYPESGSGYGTTLEEAEANYYEASGDLLIGSLDSSTFVKIADGIVVGLDSKGGLSCVVLTPKLNS